MLLHTWVSRHWQHHSEWVHPKADWVLSLTTWDAMLSSFPSIAWLGSFILACPVLAADQCPNSNTYKSHRYTSWLKQCRHTATATLCILSFILSYFFTFFTLTTSAVSIYMHIHTSSYSHWWVERACWAHILLSGTVIRPLKYIAMYLRWSVENSWWDTVW